MSRHLNPDEFYSPVPGEPSSGSLHFMAAPTEWGVLSGGVAVAATDIDISALVPVGTKAVLLSGIVMGTDTADGGDGETILIVRAKGRTSTNRVLSNYITPRVSGQSRRGMGQFVSDVDANRKIQYYMAQVGQNSPVAYISCVGYYI